VKHYILSHFHFRELQRMANTCREFAERVRLVRDQVRHVEVIKGRRGRAEGQPHSSNDACAG
jgi:hypothetical protein